jgi:hypothetical protein
MYCKNCGKQIEDGSKFCEFCGASFTNESQGTQGVQCAQPSVLPNVPPCVAQGTPNAPANAKVNDDGIKALISQHRGSSEADTPYFYGYVMPSNLLFALLGSLAAFAFKNYILNFTAKGVHLYQLGLSTQLKVNNYSFISTSDIKSIKMKKGLMQWNVKIYFQQNGKSKKMNVKANKKIIGINEQVPNLERVKAMFNQ